LAQVSVVSAAAHQVGIVVLIEEREQPTIMLSMPALPVGCYEPILWDEEDSPECHPAHPLGDHADHAKRHVIWDYG